MATASRVRLGVRRSPLDRGFRAHPGSRMGRRSAGVPPTHLRPDDGVVGRGRWAASPVGNPCSDSSVTAGAFSGGSHDRPRASSGFLAMEPGRTSGDSAGTLLAPTRPPLDVQVDAVPSESGLVSHAADSLSPGFVALVPRVRTDDPAHQGRAAPVCESRSRPTAEGGARTPESNRRVTDFRVRVSRRYLGSAELRDRSVRP